MNFRKIADTSFKNTAFIEHLQVNAAATDNEKSSNEIFLRPCLPA